MPNIGNLSAELVLGTKQFTGPAKEAAGVIRKVAGATGTAGKEAAKATPPMQRLAASVKQLQAASAAGAISSSKMALGLKKSRVEANALFRAQQPVGRELTAFNAIQRDTAKFSLRSRQGLGTLRSTMASLGARMAGVNGTVGTFLGAISQFAVGNLISIGIIGGITALILGIRQLGKAAREEKKDVTALLDAFKEEQKTPVEKLKEEAQKFRRDIARIQEAHARSVARAAARGREDPAIGTGLLAPISPQAPGMSQADRDRITLNRQKIADIEREIRELTELTAKQKKARVEIEKMAAVILKINDSLRRMGQIKIAPEFRDLVGGLTGTEFERKKLAGTGAVGVVNHPLSTIPQGDLGIRQGSGQMLQAAAQVGREGAHKMRMAWEQFAVSEDGFGRVGEVAARTFVRGFLDAITTGGNLFAKLKELFVSVFKSALTEALLTSLRSQGGGLFGRILGTISSAAVGFATGGPAGAAAGGVAGVAGGGIPGQTSAANLSVTMTAPSNPLAMARDGEWLSALKESLLEAESGGFRLAGT